MKTAKEVADNLGITISKQHEDYLNRYMKTIREGKSWAEDEYSIKIQEMEIALVTLGGLSDNTIQEFKNAAINGKYN